MDREDLGGLSREELLEMVRRQQTELSEREAAIERRDEKIRELEEELPRQCLNGRIGDRDTLATKIAAWEAARNKQRATIHWQFAVDDARRYLLTYT